MKHIIIQFCFTVGLELCLGLGLGTKPHLKASLRVRIRDSRVTVACHQIFSSPYLDVDGYT